MLAGDPRISYFASCHLPLLPIPCIGKEPRMKILFVIFVSVFGLLLGGCAEQPLISDEEYNATHGPAPYSRDYSGVLPQPGGRY
jgi:hypothetical protein